MAARRQTRKPRTLPFESIYGMEFPARGTVDAGQRSAERELLRQFRGTKALHSELAAASKLVHASLVDSRKQDKRALEGGRRLRQLHDRLSKQRLPFPRVPKSSQRIFTGSIGATVTPPYDYPWVWDSTSGQAPGHTESADINAGTMGFSFSTSQNGSSQVIGLASVGIGFHQLPDCPTLLQVWANPMYNFGWSTTSASDSAHTDGWIGLRVDAFNVGTNSPAGTPISQQIPLWWSDTWWNGSGNWGTNKESNLYAALIVDKSHWYKIRVACGGMIFGAGWNNWFGIGSGATADLSASVPWIQWQLG